MFTEDFNKKNSGYVNEYAEFHCSPIKWGYRSITKHIAYKQQGSLQNKEEKSIRARDGGWLQGKRVSAAYKRTAPRMYS